MSKVLYSATMSVDGFIAGAGGDMSWLRDLIQTGPGVDELVQSIGALLIGKRTYTGDDPNKGTDNEGAFEGAWHGPSFVVTHEQPAPDAEADVTFVNSITAGVAAAKDAAGGKYVNVLGANVAKQCLEAGLLDEILVFVAPILLGDGVRLFEHAGGTRVRLEQIDRDRTDDLRLWYRVVRQ